MGEIIDHLQTTLTVNNHHTYHVASYSIQESIMYQNRSSLYIIQQSFTMHLLEIPMGSNSVQERTEFSRMESIQAVGVLWL